MIDFQIGNHFQSRCYSLVAHLLFENRPLTHFQTLRDDLRVINAHLLFENRPMIDFQTLRDDLKIINEMQNAFPVLKTVIFFNIAPIHRDLMAFSLIPYLKIDPMIDSLSSLARFSRFDGLFAHSLL